MGGKKLIEENKRIKAELAAIKDAYWSYMLDHAEILPSGAIFVKFHTDSRSKFEKHVRARWKWDYHRNDPVVVEKIAEERRVKFVEKKESKKAKFKREKALRKAKYEETLRALKRVQRYNKARSFGRELKSLFYTFMATIVHLLLVPKRVTFECPHCLGKSVYYVERTPSEVECRRCHKKIGDLEIHKEMIKGN